MAEARRIAGALLGCAVGDALGVPYEGLSKRRGVRLLGEPTRMRFLLGHSVVSDDTDHSCLILQAFCESPTDVTRFQRRFARHLRWWLLSLPAGIGSATLRSIGKLWLGFSPTSSGVFSAGNGPAMRAAVLGAAIDSLDHLRQYVQHATQLTHTDPKAFDGAWAVACAAWYAARRPLTSAGFWAHWKAEGDPHTQPAFREQMTKLETSLQKGESTTAFADQLGCTTGVSGYVLHTVPVALHLALSQPTDLRSALMDAVRCGGDADTVAAIVGGIVGCHTGPEALPTDWLTRVWAWPRSASWMTHLAEAAARANTTQQPQPVPAAWLPACVARNLIFLVGVWLHIARRLLPPYR